MDIRCPPVIWILNWAIVAKEVEGFSNPSICICVLRIWCVMFLSEPRLLNHVRNSKFYCMRQAIPSVSGECNCAAHTLTRWNSIYDWRIASPAKPAKELHFGIRTIWCFEHFSTLVLKRFRRFGSTTHETFTCMLCTKPYIPLFNHFFCIQIVCNDHFAFSLSIQYLVYSSKEYTRVLNWR